MNTIPPYKLRPVTFIETKEQNGWKIKTYVITAKGVISIELVNKICLDLFSKLPQPAVCTNRYGVGFFTIHQGTMRNWFLLDWWEDEDILHHLLFSSPLDEPNNITAEPDKTLIACVHELRVINFESEAWVKYLQSEDLDSGITNYLKQTMNEI